MVTGPVVIPVTIPVNPPMVALDGLLLVHIPDGVGSDKVIVDPWQTRVEPEIAYGNG